jgi:hypothetical protein
VTRRQAQPLPQLLLFAEGLRAAGLARWLETEPPRFRIVTDPTALEGAPQLVLWSLSHALPPAALQNELQGLLDRWQPAPLLLLLPDQHPYPAAFLLALPVQGLLHNPHPELVREAVDTLLQGGRLVDIGPEATTTQPEGSLPGPVGLGQWLLSSGLLQIDAELRICQGMLERPNADPFARMLLEGRMRELKAARGLLLWLWGPASLAWAEPPVAVAAVATAASLAAGAGLATTGGGVAITLRQRSADGIWESLRQRLEQTATSGAENRSGQLLALDGLAQERRSDLLLALLEQLEKLRQRLRQGTPGSAGLLEQWEALQPELRRQALIRVAGSYVQLPCEGSLRPVAEALASRSELTLTDPELPDPMAMLTTLIEARPLLVEGRLLPPDEPQALLYLEMLLANWLVRSAELISAEILAACAEWPELRRYLLRPELLATRNLERLRNQLNAQQRWSQWVSRPIQLYESRRPLFRLEAGAIHTVDITEPRDQELRQLGWLQQLVTLTLETRDALAPQLQNLIRGLGDLVVVVLTQVVGRAIGLVGRGIAQGMGRSLGRS